MNPAVLLSCLFFLMMILNSCSNKENKNDLPSGYHLVWSDEFDYEGQPDPQKWTYENGFVRNQELQWYSPENAYCKDGHLVIKAEKNRRSNPDYKENSESWKESREFAEYTSASVTTKGLHSWRYGIFEIRAKVDARAGLWPAIWTLGVEKPWPHNGEIDIMEYYRDMILANFAWGDSLPYQPVWDDSKKLITDFPANWTDDFHTWKMIWTPDSIQLFVDDLLLNETDLSQTINKDGSGFNPFHQPHFLILNLAIGGTQGGNPDKTQFPATFLVDYVRVYQEK